MTKKGAVMEENRIEYIMISKFKKGAGVESVVNFLFDCVLKKMTKNCLLVYKCYNSKESSKNGTSKTGIRVPHIRIIEDLVYNLIYFLKVYRILRSSTHKITIVANAEEGLGAALLKIIFRRKVRYIHIVHGIWRRAITTVKTVQSIKFRILTSIELPLMEFLEIFPLKFADRIVVVSYRVKNDLSEYYNISEEKIRVIYNPIDTSFQKFDKDKCRQILNLPQDKKIILFVGNDVYIKGLDIFLSVAGKIWANDLFLVFVSKNRIVPKLLERSKIPINKIKIFPELDKQFLNFLYSASDMLLFLSRYESFGITPVEAIFSGTISIVSRNTGVAEILLEKGVSELVTSLKEQEILSKIKPFLNPDAKHLKVISEVKRIFEDINKQVIVEYESVLKRGT